MYAHVRRILDFPLSPMAAAFVSRDTYPSGVRAPLKTLITGGQLNYTHLQPAKTLTAIRAACVFCRQKQDKTHHASRCDSF